MRVLVSCAILLVLGAAALAQAEVVQRGGVKVNFDGGVAPKKLPRLKAAPVSVSVSARISSAGEGEAPPPLRRIEIEINRHGRLDATGLPTCDVSDIQPATTAKALAACGPSLVGEGRFSAEVSLTRQAAFPSVGRMLAFNGTYRGRPAILGHVFGREPFPTSFTLPFVISRSKGSFGTKLTATLPASKGSVVTGIELSLERTYVYRGKRRSFASAACPAPRGSSAAVFPFARASFAFRGGKILRASLIRSCGVSSR